MNPDTVVQTHDIVYSYDYAAKSDIILELLKNRGEEPKTYKPVESKQQKQLHDSNPALKNLWEQYVTMVNLVQE